MTNLKTLLYMGAEVAVTLPEFTLWNGNVDLQGYVFDGTDITTIGNASSALTIAQADRGQPAALSTTAVAVAGSDGFNNRELGKYEYNPITEDWDLVGNILGLSNSLVTTLGLGPNRCAVAFQNAGIRTYDFDGTDWSQTGNISGSQSANLMATLNNTDGVNFNTGFNQLRRMSFDGTDWNNVFTTVLTFECTGLAAMTSTRVAVWDRDNKELIAYDDTGSAWTQVGNAAALGGPNFDFRAICALSASRIVIASSINNTMDVYDFDGTDFTHVGNQLTTAGAGGIPGFSDLTNQSYLLI